SDVCSSDLAARCDLRSPSPSPRRASGRCREPQLLSAAGPGGARLRLLGAERVRDGALDRHRIEVRHGRGGDTHLDLAALALDLDHAPTAELAFEPDVAGDGLEPAALHPGTSTLPSGGTDGDAPAQGRGAPVLAGAA